MAGFSGARGSPSLVPVTLPKVDPERHALSLASYPGAAAPKDRGGF